MVLKLEENGKINREQILALGADFSVSFDESYIQFLENSNGGWNSSSEESVNKFPLMLGDEIFETNIETMFGIGIDGEDINDWTTSFIEYEKTVAIGNTLLSGLIVFIDIPELRGYYYYDHTYALETSTDDNNTYWLCKTFDEFQSMVKNPD